MATAVSTITVVIYSAVAVDSRPVGGEVASGAVGLVDRRRPVHGLGISLVAPGTGQVAAMVKGFIGQTEMLVSVRQPGIRHVADIALLVRNKVSIVLAGRRVAVMTGRTGPQHLRVIDDGGRRPNRCGVAVLANVGR